MSLATEQRRFVEAIMSSKGSAEGLMPSAQLTARQRLAIYRDSYVSRLVACLVDDYPRVHEGLGETHFHELAGRFIARHPSRSFSLNSFGAGFASWLSRARGPKAAALFPRSGPRGVGNGRGGARARGAVAAPGVDLERCPL